MNRVAREAVLVGYTNNISARHIEMAQLKLNSVICTINVLMSDFFTLIGLSLMLNMTEIIVLTKMGIQIILPIKAECKIFGSSHRHKLCF